MKGGKMNTDQPVLAQLRLLNAIESPLPLEHTEAHARVAGLAATVTIHQRFRNPLLEKADLEYLFPLPHEAAITAFELRAGERIIRASIQEIEKAHQEFEKARQQGKRAGLLESRRPNLFSIQLANIQPGEFIEAVITYHQRLEFNHGQAEFIFPMGITPKYHRPGHDDEAKGVDAPLALDPAQVGDVEITVEVDTGLRSGDPVSPSHPLIISRSAETRFTVKLDGAHLPNRDFILRWQWDGAAVQFPVWCAPSENAGTFLATFIPSLPDLAAAAIPREYIFVLDRSGSMGGEPIRQAVNALRACLRSLNPQDTFAILLFDDRLEWLSALQQITQDAVENVDQLLSTVDGRGGTEILPALSAALSLPADRERSRLVIFLTDGAVSAEAQAITQVRGQMGTARLFTFGVGPSVNRAFLKQLAHIGRGKSEFIGLDEDIEEAILRFQDRIAFPLLTNISLYAEGCQIWDVYPSELPDLYAGSPLEVVGRYKPDENTRPMTLIVRGERIGVPIEIRAAIKELAPEHALISRIWAHARADDLAEKAALGLKPEHEVRTEIISLALEHSLLTKYTAFMAVDQESPTTPGKSYTIKVAHPLPEGLELSGFVGAPAFGALSPAPRAMISEAEFDMEEDLDTPKFLRNRVHRLSEQSVSAMPRRAASSKPLPPPDSSNILNELARTQHLNGSWQEDMEYTAAALLAFVRSGHTTLKGHFRKQVARAAAWLKQSNASGFPCYLRALALRELADTTRNAEDVAAAEQSLAEIEQPANDIEAVFLAVLKNESVRKKTPKSIKSLDDLRWAVFVKTKGLRKVPAILLESELGRTLAACVFEEQ